MGADPAHSVANGFGQTHDHDNLFIAGSGLFPDDQRREPDLYAQRARGAFGQLHQPQLVELLVTGPTGRGQRARKAGLRFSLNAAIPSAWSSVMSAIPCAQDSMSR